MAQRLTGKTAMITGGAGGIGAATGRLFCEEGASVLLVDRDAAACQAAVEEIARHADGSRVAFAKLDVARESAAAEAVSIALDRFGRLDCLINNAAIRSYEPLAEAKSETWRDVLAVNLLSYAFFARAALPALRQSGSGSIVNVASTYGVNMRAGMGQYDATKAGIISMTRTLAAEETRNGVRVNAVCPGFTLTPFHIRRAKDADQLRTEHRPECLIGRWADPREIAYPILWLASAEASYMTAAVIMADGGMPIS